MAIMNTTLEKTSAIIIRSGEQKTLFLPTKPGVHMLEITLEAESELNLTYIQTGPSNGENMLALRITLQEGSRLNSFFAMLGCARAGLKVETHLEGDRSELCEKTIFFGNENQIFNMFSTTLMKGKHTRALVESKGILTDSSQARFDGTIHIWQSAKQANAKLNEHTLLLSPEAKMNAIPGLKIDTNDVIATHSASMTRVDDEQLFYAASRGIEEREAIRLIADGFLMSLYKGTSFEENMHQLICEKICRL